MPDPWRSCFLHFDGAGGLVFKLLPLPVPRSPSRPDGPQWPWFQQLTHYGTGYRHVPSLGLCVRGSAREEGTEIQNISQGQ